MADDSSDNVWKLKACTWLMINPTSCASDRCSTCNSSTNTVAQASTLVRMQKAAFCLVALALLWLSILHWQRSIDSGGYLRGAHVRTHVHNHSIFADGMLCAGRPSARPWRSRHLRKGKLVFHGLTGTLHVFLNTTLGSGWDRPERRRWARRKSGS